LKAVFTDELLERPPDCRFARRWCDIPVYLSPASTGMYRYIVKNGLIREGHETIFQIGETINILIYIDFLACQVIISCILKRFAGYSTLQRIQIESETINLLINKNKCYVLQIVSE